VQYYFAIFIFLTGATGDSWLTPKETPNYLSSYLSLLTTLHLLIHLNVGAVRRALIRWVGFIQPVAIQGSYPRKRNNCV